MGEEILVRTPSPQSEVAGAIEQGAIFQGNGRETILEEGDGTKENGINSDDSKAIEEKRDIFQGLKDSECSIIPSPMLKAESLTSYFGPDLASAIQIIGTKYNELVNKYQEQNDITNKLKSEFEVLSNKCAQDCEPKYEELKDKYTRECFERKRLYNEIIELKGNIRVFCRCRPLSSEEISKGYTSVVEFDPSHDSELQVVLADSTKKHFVFDHVFNPKADQEVVFAETLPVVKSVMDGYNVCIFAYGQTGTGKTFTMEGDSKNRGVNYRALKELFMGSTNRMPTNRYEFSVSMLEVYNEKIRDLLLENSSDMPAKKLDIKQINGTQEVPGLVDTAVSSLDEVWDILQTGAKNRSVGSTNANELSSRSHCLVRVTVKGENFVNGERNKSHMWLVDLAGSERVGKTEAEGERLKESQFINKSLSALGDVIAALASKNPHIPYRNSKLTHLLQSSLGGDCKTLMFTQISPSSADLGETLCSLNFATRVRGIESGPIRKQVDPAESFKVKQMAEKLRHEEKETARLNETLQLMQNKYASRENIVKAQQERIRDAEQTSKNYQMKVRELENQLAKSNSSSAKHLKPPLAQIQERRQPLARISTNNRFPPGTASRASNITTAFSNKENMFSNKYNSNKTNMMHKARRISLSPVMRCNIPNQPKRRASIAVLPSESEKRGYNHATTVADQLSHMRMMPRRRLSEATFPMRTPDGYNRFSSSRFSSPSKMQAVWKSRIPTVSASSSSSSPSMNRLCFSVQKRVVVGSPVQAKSGQAMKYRSNQQMSNSMSTLFGGGLAGFGNRGSVGLLGTAQRVAVTKKRRQTLV